LAVPGLVQPRTTHAGTARKRLKTARHGGCREPCQAMTTEFVIVTLTVALFGMCALFVRVCDRI